MKKMLLGIGVSLLLTGCSAPDSFMKDNQKVDMESSVDQKAVHTYIKKAQAHLSSAPNYKPGIYEEKLMKMASNSFQISIEDAAKIYIAYEYDK